MLNITNLLLNRGNKTISTKVPKGFIDYSLTHLILWPLFSSIKISAFLFLSITCLPFILIRKRFLPFFCHANAKLPPKHWTLIVIEYIASTILHCWVMRLTFEQNCAPSVASRLPLCIQYIPVVTKFFYLPFVIDLSRRDHGIFGP